MPKAAKTMTGSGRVSDAKETKNSEADDGARQARIREVAMQHALGIQEKKNLQGKVLDMILVAYDLPSSATADPAHPDSTDVSTFRDCLRIWRPSDLDELVQERNLDDRCGYALCSRPNQKQKATKIWARKEGTFADKPVDERWCSTQCKQRNDFARYQLGSEPAWLRQAQIQDIRLLTDSELEDNTNATLESRSQRRKIVDEDALAQERGETTARPLADIPIHEKELTSEPKPPTITPQITVRDVLEGMPLRQTRDQLNYG